ALFLPAQLGLIMGQTSATALLAFCGLVRLADRRPALASALVGLSPVSWKPQLLAPTLVVALAAARRWRWLAWLLAGPTALCLGYTLIVGPGWLADYQAQASGMWSLVSQGSSIESAGQTLLGLCHALFGPGPIATLVALAGGATIEVLVAAVWWRGLRRDARRDLQFALLPVAGVLAAPHALGYDLTLWLASLWLLIRYVEYRPSAGPLVTLLALAGWAVANTVVLTENDLGFPWAALEGLALVAAIVWLYATHPPQPAVDQG
ncbi:MAG TPA: hypothetical protein VF937_13810, partial [Chloroflexota bacterium]